MDAATNRITRILEAFQRGELGLDQAVDAVSSETRLDVRVDHDREDRTGVPELVWAEGKSDSQLLEAVGSLWKGSGRALVSRVTPEQATILAAEFPRGRWHEGPRLFVISEQPVRSLPGRIAVACAGTSDSRVAEEAAVTAEFLGLTVDRVYDVGVAGIHRLLGERDRLADAGVVIAVAGMEGAMPSVLAGLVPGLVIAVPTSVGYGLHLDGVTPFLAMLNSCAPGVLVTNVDNGLGAGVAAAKLHRHYSSLGGRDS